MANAINSGTVHIFGVGGSVVATLLNATLQSSDFTERPAINEDVLDALGRTIQKRYDDIRYETSYEGILVGDNVQEGKTGVACTIGDNYTIAGIKYIIEEISVRGTNRGFASVNIRGVHYPEVDEGGTEGGGGGEPAP